MQCSNNSYSTARVKRAYCLTSGLFSSLGKRERSRKSAESGDTCRRPPHSERFTIPERLGVDDLRIFLAVLATAGEINHGPHQEMTDGMISHLKTQLRHSGQTPQKKIRIYSVKLTDVLNTAGLQNSGSKRRQAMASLLRLAQVQIAIENSSFGIATHQLLAFRAGEQRGLIHILLNPGLSAGIFCESQYSQVPMAEFRLLESDPARIIYYRLCGWVDQGKSVSISLDTLCEYVWSMAPDMPNTNTLRGRQARVRKAMNDIRSVGWNVEWVREDMVRLTRAASKHLRQTVTNTGGRASHRTATRQSIAPQSDLYQKG